jgi:hypothetical protein
LGSAAFVSLLIAVEIALACNSPQQAAAPCGNNCRLASPEVAATETRHCAFLLTRITSLQRLLQPLSCKFCCSKKMQAQASKSRCVLDQARIKYR